MKLFKREKENTAFQSEIKGAGMAMNNPFQSKVSQTFPPPFQAAKTTAVHAVFPKSIEKSRETSLWNENNAYLLMTLLKELAKVGDKNNFTTILNLWSITLVQDVLDECYTIEEEEHFELLVQLLNQLMMLRHLGCFQCMVDEAARIIRIDYFSTRIDQACLDQFGEIYTTAFIGNFFERLMSAIVEVDCKLHSIEGSTETWTYIYKA
ncbi:hypothetical protein [Sulfuricurvum sp.]|uniref:hypothetical protein n=1 Tax=Sulfuricurvum sp. TaxID=2025608 RepID=UPI00260A890D|nr:hypothetical protein [Sulfuricurvum sp.]MDD2266158.1 hypothetical protein [Sulfuricurvum sp.]MDD2784053.1 hypothetical protein [Sulfuricurvum sp.]